MAEHFDVFLSHNSDDKPNVERLARKLRDAGFKVWLDIWELIPGQPWQPAIERALRQSDACIVCIGPTGIGPWHHEEMRVAIDRRVSQRGFPVIPILLPGAIRDNQEELPSFLVAATWVEFNNDLDDEHALHRLVSGIRGQAPGPGDVVTPESPQTLSWPSINEEYPWILADRRAGFERFKNVISGQLPKRILLVEGKSNTGKTAYLSELRKCAIERGLVVASVDFKGSPLMNEVFDTLRIDLGPNILHTTYNASDSSRLLQILVDLQCATTPILITFDTYEQASDEARTWLESKLLNRLDRIPGVVVIVGGQQVPDYRKYSWRSMTEYEELQPIRELKDWIDFIKANWGSESIDVEFIEKLIISTLGNPGLSSSLIENFYKQVGGNE